jgi:hypothetical protein
MCCQALTLPKIKRCPHSNLCEINECGAYVNVLSTNTDHCVVVLSLYRFKGRINQGFKYLNLRLITYHVLYELFKTLNFFKKNSLLKNIEKSKRTLKWLIMSIDKSIVAVEIYEIDLFFMLKKVCATS